MCNSGGMVTMTCNDNFQFFCEIGSKLKMGSCWRVYYVTNNIV